MKGGENDEEDEDVGFIESKGTITEQDKIKMYEQSGQSFPLSKSLVILSGTKPCVFDIEAEKWERAENEEVVDQAKSAKNFAKGKNLETKIFSFPDNCGAVFLDNKLNYKGVVPLVITGGNKHGKISSKAFGISFEYTFKNGLKDIVASQQVQLPQLPLPLYLHQSAAVMIDQKVHIIVMGGKESVQSNRSLNTVYKLRIHEFISQRDDIGAASFERMLQEQNEQKNKVQLWQQCSSMSSGRSMFACTVIDYKFVYVYGGIQEESQGYNLLANNVVERYDVIADAWTVIQVQNAPNLSGFGWCNGTEQGEIFVLGGSDGYVLQGSLWKINLVRGIAEDLGVEYDNQICMSKLAVRQNKLKGLTTLYSFGGSNSEGFCFKCDIQGAAKREWKQLQQSYLSLFSSSQDDISDKKFIFK